jgi:hypothetical protein
MKIAAPDPLQQFSKEAEIKGPAFAQHFVGDAEVA